IHVARELDIAAERQRRELPARAPPVGEAGDLAAEADRERIRLDPEQPPDEVVAEFVDDHQRPEDQQESDKPHPDRGGLKQGQMRSSMAAARRRVARSRSKTSARSNGAGGKLPWSRACATNAQISLNAI